MVIFPSTVAIVCASTLRAQAQAAEISRSG
jgi:hypothetical protein